MNKKITIAMLLVLMQTLMYSAQVPEGEGCEVDDWMAVEAQFSEGEGNDWMAVKPAPGSNLRLRSVQASQPTQDTETTSTTICNQENLEEGSAAGFCAVVANLLEAGFGFLKNQAYEKPPFVQQDQASREKNK